jgi:hypothetical protein
MLALPLLLLLLLLLPLRLRLLHTLHSQDPRGISPDKRFKKVC